MQKEETNQAFLDHNILLLKLSGFDVHNALLRWVAASLEGRTKFISLMDATSTARVLNGGIPQGTKLGPLLFAIMVNDLVSSWVPRAKYVDDLTVLEVVPRNSPSMLNFVVNEIESYAISNNMRLDPSKRKELSVDFLRYNSCDWQPIAVGGAFIERVPCFLGSISRRTFLGLPIGPTGDCMLLECLTQSSQLKQGIILH